MQEQVKAQPVKTDPRMNFLERLAAGKEKSQRSEADNKRLLRAWRKALRIVSRPQHMTKVGFALIPTQKAGQSAYLLTPREHARRKAMHRQQKASRRANRGR